MSLKVRPFERIIERPGGMSAIRVCGSVVDGEFIFSVDGASWCLLTIECASDPLGMYALLKEGEIQLSDRFVIRIREGVSDPDARDLDLGSKISLVKPGDTTLYEQTLKAQGHGPKQFNLLVPPEALISVSFGSDGDVKGDTCMGPAVANLKATPRMLN